MLAYVRSYVLYIFERLYNSLFDRAGCLTPAKGGGSTTAIACVTSPKMRDGMVANPTLSSRGAMEAMEAVIAAADDSITLDSDLASRKIFPAIKMLQVMPLVLFHFIP